jgi:hypothetical protein
MKKLLFIISLGLTLTGCFHDPKETALENCANSKFMEKYLHFEKYIVDNPLVVKELDKSISAGNIKASRNNIKNSKKIMMEFAEKNFNLSEDETYAILNKSYNNTEGLSDEVMKILEMPHDPEEAINKIKGTKEQKDQFKKIIKDYNIDRDILKLNLSFKVKLTTKLFLELKMRDKFLVEQYQKIYQRCERIYNELPSSFINKWEHNTELKEFLN